MKPANRALVSFVATALVLASCTDEPGRSDPSSPARPSESSLPGPTDPGEEPLAGDPFEVHMWEEPSPPLAALITTAVVDEWTVRVEGAPGAVPASGRLLVADIGTARGAIADVMGDGSFSAEITSRPGGMVQIALLSDHDHDPQPGLTLGDVTHQTLHQRPSTYVRVPADPPEGLASAAHPVTAVSVSHFPEGPVWAFTGGVEDLGDEVRVAGEMLFRLIEGVSPSTTSRSGSQESCLGSSTRTATPCPRWAPMPPPM